MRDCNACYTNTTTNDLYLCEACLQQMRAQLTRLPSILHDLAIETRRQARKTPGNNIHHTTPEQPLPYQPEAADCTRNLTRIRETITALAETIPAQTQKLATLPTAPQTATQLTHEIRRATRICDTPPEAIHYGQCGQCELAITAPKTRTEYRCACGATYDLRLLAEYRDWRAHDPNHVLTLAEIAILTGINPATLRTWRHRKRLTPTTTWKDKTLYRLGDAIALTGIDPKWAEYSSGTNWETFLKTRGSTVDKPTR